MIRRIAGLEYASLRQRMMWRRLPFILAFCAVLIGALLGSEAGGILHRADHLVRGETYGFGEWR
jgi:hypothetical protein